MFVSSADTSDMSADATGTAAGLDAKAETGKTAAVGMCAASSVPHVIRLSTPDPSKVGSSCVLATFRGPCEHGNPTLCW